MLFVAFPTLNILLVATKLQNRIDFRLFLQSKFAWALFLFIFLAAISLFLLLLRKPLASIAERKAISHVAIAIAAAAPRLLVISVFTVLPKDDFKFYHTLASALADGKIYRQQLHIAVSAYLWLPRRPQPGLSDLRTKGLGRPDAQHPCGYRDSYPPIPNRQHTIQQSDRALGRIILGFLAFPGPVFHAACHRSPFHNFNAVGHPVFCVLRRKEQKKPRGIGRPGFALCNRQLHQALRHRPHPLLLLHAGAWGRRRERQAFAIGKADSPLPGFSDCIFYRRLVAGRWPVGHHPEGNRPFPRRL